MWEQTAGAREGVEPTEPDAFAGWETLPKPETVERQNIPTRQETDRNQGTPPEHGISYAQEEPSEMVEIEGGTIGGDNPLLFSSPRLPYDIVIEKLRTAGLTFRILPAPARKSFQCRRKVPGYSLA